MQKSASPGSASAEGASPDASAVPAEGGIPPVQPSPRLEKSRTDRKVFGVCGGIGRHMGIDPTLVRFAFVLVGFASFGLALLMYVLLAIFLPKEERAPAMA